MQKLIEILRAYAGRAAVSTVGLRLTVRATAMLSPALRGTASHHFNTIYDDLRSDCSARVFYLHHPSDESDRTCSDMAQCGL